MNAATLASDGKLSQDLRLLGLFIETYCRHHHHGDKKVVEIKTHDVTAINGRELELCDECRKLLTHAYVKRTHCPLHPKPQCKHCPSHCYHPLYRQQIRTVMRDSGMRLLLSGRVHYLLHLLF